MIQIENLTKSFGDLQVLKGVNLTIEKGEVVSIVGSSGAGKTTLLQLIGTLDKPTSGTIRFGGEDLSRLSNKRLAAFRNRHIGFVPACAFTLLTNEFVRTSLTFWSLRVKSES